MTEVRELPVSPDTLAAPETRIVARRRRRARRVGKTFYRVRLLIDCAGPNPRYDRSRPIGPDNPAEIMIPAGTIIEDPDAFYLCLPEPRTEEVRAEPMDDATAERVQACLQRRETILADRAKAAERVAADKPAGRRRRSSG